MTSLLQPAYALVLGSQEWAEQLLGLDLTLEAAPLVDSLVVRLPAAAPLSAEVGDDVRLKLESGEKSQDVFRGTIDCIRRSHREIHVRALNASGVLARYRPAATYEQISAADLIRNLCGDVGVEVGDVEDGVKFPFYAADPTRTALEHVARVCAWSGAMARVTPDNALESLVVNGAAPEVALKHGRELLALEQGALVAGAESFVVAGESGAGSESSPLALRLTTDFFAGARPDGPSSTHLWRWEPALRTAMATGTAGAASTRLYQSGRQRGRLTAFLQPDLRPGTVFEIQELPGGLEGGPFWITGVSHRLSADGAWTRARFYRGGDAFDPAALLAALVGSLF